MFAPPFQLCLFAAASLVLCAARAEDVSKPSATAPAASWQASAAEHAHLLSQVRWTPVAGTMPERNGGFFEKGKEYTGVPYSSVKADGRYIGFDINLRTFLAAVENPLSVLYTQSLAGKTANAASFYGTVCSSFTSYALQCAIPEVSRRHGPGVSKGVERVQPQTAQAAQVGDVIYTPHTTERDGSHVELVTAVTKDAQGRVTSVRVEESRPMTTKTTDRSPEAFEAHLKHRNKLLFRVTDLDAWRGGNRAESLQFPNYKLDATRPEINRTLLLDLGDWVPYQKGKPVKINVMDRDGLGVKALVIRRDGKVVEEVPVSGPGVVERTFKDCGDYTAHVLRPDGSASSACEFAVCDLELQLPEGSVSLAKEWRVQFKGENIPIAAVYLFNEEDSYGRHPIVLSEEERRAGSVSIPAGLLKKPGKVQVWLIGEHRLGRLKVRRDVQVGEK
ncbi:hypothetical protein [Prosthecobacter vanneervenii]|uniref:Peptidase C51 domain-containing protein n=1 Tax=Prosthecobacter vanneervenii TaxID=48466 RepID=A0A7W7YB95_9BACT|nr:hypothetical protein [Prosthecobacter vanneervenii]MBB5032670.1 hypothetical protein [Prosthecobacter vanneervenii]